MSTDDLYRSILQTDLPDALVLQRDVIDYFPVPLRETYHDEILRHRLRREIATTRLANQMVNLSGISYDHRMTEDTGASVTDVSRAWLVAREVLGFPEWWEEIGRLTGVALDDQLELYMDCRRTAERCSLWFLRHRRPPVDIDAVPTPSRSTLTAISVSLVLRDTLAFRSLAAMPCIPLLARSVALLSAWPCKRQHGARDCIRRDRPYICANAAGAI